MFFTADYVVRLRILPKRIPFWIYCCSVEQLFFRLYLARPSLTANRFTFLNFPEHFDSTTFHSRRSTRGLCVLSSCTLSSPKWYVSEGVRNLNKFNFLCSLSIRNSISTIVFIGTGCWLRLRQLPTRTMAPASCPFTSFHCYAVTSH